MRLRDWLMRLTDRRRSVRIRPDALVAYYWTGGAPKAMEVRNMASTERISSGRNNRLPATLISLMLKIKRPPKPRFPFARRWGGRHRMGFASRSFCGAVAAAAACPISGPA